MTYLAPNKYPYPSSADRDMAWLRAFLFARKSQQHIADESGYVRHYVSFCIRRRAKHITEAIELTDLAAACAAFGLTADEAKQIQVYFRTKRPGVRKGGAAQ